MIRKGKIKTDLLAIVCFSILFSVIILNSNAIALPIFNENGYSGKFHIATIQDEINAANPGDVIYIPEGKYYEHLYINKPITLIGAGKNKTILDASNSGTAIQIVTDNVTISGFKIQNSALSGENAGIVISNCCNVTIRNSTVINCKVAIYAENMHNSTIEENDIIFNFESGIILINSKNNRIIQNNLTYGTPYGVKLINSTFNIISGNYISHFCQGICLEMSVNNSITQNKLMYISPYAIHLDNSNDNYIEENNVIKNNFGIYLFQSCRNKLKNNMVSFQTLGIYLLRSENNALEGNILVDNWHNFGVNGNEPKHFVNNISSTNLINGKPVYFLLNATGKEINSSAGFVALVNCHDILVKDIILEPNFHGIILVDSSNLTIINSTIHDNYSYGIYMMNVEQSVLMYNTISRNDVGIYAVNSSNNKVFYNNFVDNNQHVICDENSVNLWNETFGGNYWSGYRTIDVNRDGIGDIPYTINTKNSDKRPFISEIRSFTLKTTNLTATGLLSTNASIQNMEFNVENEVNIMLLFIINNKNASYICLIIIPKVILHMKVENWQLQVNKRNSPIKTFEDNKNVYLYFNFSKKECGSLECQITVHGTYISEFPVFPSTLLIFLMIVLLFIKKRGKLVG